MVRLAQLWGELNILQVFWGGSRGVFLAHMGGSLPDVMACFGAYAWHAIRFLRSCRGPALAELGHPDVAAGRYSCAARSHGCGKPFRTEPAGRRIDFLYGTTTAPKYLSASLGELSAVPHPSIPFPAFAHTLPKPRSRGAFPSAQPTPKTYPRFPASCLRYLTRVFSFPPPRTLFPS